MGQKFGSGGGGRRGINKQRNPYNKVGQLEKIGPTFLHKSLSEDFILPICLPQRKPRRITPKDHIEKELIGPKLFKRKLSAIASSKLCEFI